MKSISIKHIFIIPVIIWMIVVFKYSNEPSDTSKIKSLNITKKIVEILLTNRITEEDKNELIKNTDKIVRKLAHYLLYLVGGIVIMIYLSQFKIQENRKILYSTIIGSIYACTDEVHQLFIPGRTGKLADVWIDSLGIVTGVCICLLIINIYTNQKKNNI